MRLYFEATPFLSSDLEVLFNGFDGDFEVEGEIDHPNGDKVLVETAPSERALRSYVYIGDEVINNYSTLVFGLELNNADVTMRNSYQDLFIDLGSLRRNLETVESGGFKSGPGYLGYDYTLSQGDTFSLVYRANAFHVRESLESEEANEPTTGELDYIHDLNPIGGFNSISIILVVHTSTRTAGFGLSMTTHLDCSVWIQIRVVSNEEVLQVFCSGAAVIFKTQVVCRMMTLTTNS